MSLLPCALNVVCLMSYLDSHQWLIFTPINPGLELFTFYHLQAPFPTIIPAQSWVAFVLLIQAILSSDPKTHPDVRKEFDNSHTKELCA